MLEMLKNSQKTVGIKQSLKAVEDGKAQTVFIASDADERITASIKRLCKEKSVKVVYVESMKSLGKACNIDVGASVVALLK